MAIGHISGQKNQEETAITIVERPQPFGNGKTGKVGHIMVDYDQSNARIGANVVDRFLRTGESEAWQFGQVQEGGRHVETVKVIIQHDDRVISGHGFPVGRGARLYLDCDRASVAGQQLFGCSIYGKDGSMFLDVNALVAV